MTRIFWPLVDIASIVIIVLTVLLVVVGVVTIRLMHHPKILEWRIASDSALLTHDPVAGDLTVDYKGQAVPNPRVVGLEVRNQGKVEIRPEDFDRLIEIGVPNQTRRS